MALGRLSFLQQPPWVSVPIEATILVALSVTVVVPQIQNNQEIFMSIFSHAVYQSENSAFFIKQAKDRSKTAAA